MPTKPFGQRGTAAAQADPAAAKLAADAPLVLTLRDVEVPLPPAEAARPADDGLVVSDTESRPPPWLGDPEVERTQQRAARRAQVRKDRLRAAALDTDVPTLQAEPGLLEAAPAVPRASPEPPEQGSAGAEGTIPAATSIAASLVAPPAAASTDAAATAPVVAAPPAAIAAAAPAVLVLSAADAGLPPLREQLSAFGFDVEVRADPPDLPAPWPFVAVFVDLALRPDGGGDAIDLCNEVRERSRLPGLLKPVLVLVADQLSATNRVRAGLAGCNEIQLGEITRGSVARILDTRGIALPSDARR